MVVVEKDDAGRSLKAWVSMEFPQLAVSPKQKIKLDFSIAIPENAEPGTYWGTLVVRTLPSEAGEGSAIETKLGSILLLLVFGEAREQLVLETFSAPRFVDSSPARSAIGEIGRFNHFVLLPNAALLNKPRLSGIFRAQFFADARPASSHHSHPARLCGSFLQV